MSDEQIRQAIAYGAMRATREILDALHADYQRRGWWHSKRERPAGYRQAIEQVRAYQVHDQPDEETDA